MPTNTTSNRIPDPVNGYLTVIKCPITRPGLLDYKRFELGLKDGDPNDDLTVYRPEEEVKNQNFLDSLKLIPITIGHTFLNGDPANRNAVAPEAKTYEGVISENVWYEDGWVWADVRIFTQRAQKLLQGYMNGLSVGANGSTKPAQGSYDGVPYQYIQSNLIANHVAMTDTPRIEGAKIADSRENLTTSLQQGATLMADEPSTQAPAAEPSNDFETLKQQMADLTKIVQQFIELQEKSTSTTPVGDAEPNPDSNADLLVAADPPMQTTMIASVDENGQPVMNAATSALPPTDPSLSLQDCSADPSKPDHIADEEGDGANDRDNDKDKLPKTEADIARIADSRFKALEADKRRALDLQARASKVVGTINAPIYDSTQSLAGYLVNKLGLKNIPKGHEITAVESYLNASARAYRNVLPPPAPSSRFADSRAAF